MTNEEIAAYYERLLAEHGPDHRAADCGSLRSQVGRLTVLREVAQHDRLRIDQGPLKDAIYSVLDVGCGAGRLSEIVAVWANYEGWDISIPLVNSAQRHARQQDNFPNGYRRFLVRDLMESTEKGAFDYVVASGLFQFRDALYLRCAVERMWELCRKAIAFNFLTQSDGTPGETQHDPLSVLAFCCLLSPKVVLRLDYLPNDATVYVYR